MLIHQKEGKYFTHTLTQTEVGVGNLRTLLKSVKTSMKIVGCFSNFTVVLHFRSCETNAIVGFVKN